MEPGDLARPATYILDRKGNVVFAYVAGSDTTYDRPAVKQIARETAAGGYRFASLAQAICRSVPFQMRQAEQTR